MTRPTTDTSRRDAASARPPVVAMPLVSAAALAYEILLMRLFSIALWHHFAYMIISLALLGYGASGGLVTLAQDAVRRHFAPQPDLRHPRSVSGSGGA